MTTPPCANANPPALSELGAMGDEELNDMLNDMLGIIECEHWGHLWGGNMVKNETCGHTNCRPIGCRPKYCSNHNAVAEVRRGLSEDERHWFSFNVQRQLEMDLTSFVRDFQACFKLIDANLRIQTIALILCKTH